MRILRLYHRIPPMKGGMEKHILFLSKYQNNDNFISVYFNQGEQTSENDIKILPFLKLYKIRPNFIGVFLFYIFVLLKLIFKQQKFDVIHLHGDWSSLVFSKLIKKLTKAKITVFTFHGMITNNYAHQKLLPKFLKDIDLIFTTGYESGKLIKALTYKEIIIQPSGVADFFFQTTPKTFEANNFKIVTVANLHPVKNLSLILDIAKKCKECEFLIIGEGVEKSFLLNKISLDKINNIKLIGYKSAAEIKEIFDISDCFLLTSLEEGTPTAALEAIASGLPIISSNAGGIDHIIKDSKNGFVINNFEKSDYIDKIMLLKQDINLRKNISENNLNISKDYRWNYVAGRITQLTKKCFDAKK